MSARQPSAVEQLVQGLRQLRLQGQSLQALEPGDQALAQFPGEPALVAELVRILVALKQADMAIRLLGTLGEAGVDACGLEPPFRARLALLRGETVRAEGLPDPGKEGWLAHYLDTGEDACPPARWERLDIKVQGGPADFFLAGACAFCGHGVRFNLPVSLLVDRGELCPACCGRLRVFWGDIEEFLRDKHGGFLDLDTGETDWELLDLVRERTRPGGGAPEVIRNLGQEYQFLLNEILTGHMLADQGGKRGDNP